MNVSASFAQGVDTSRLSAAVYRKFSRSLNVSVSKLRAVVHVEAGKAGFWNDGNMKLLYEGHIAYRETDGALRKKLVKAGLAWRSWGDVKYGKASVSRVRLHKALAIAGKQAYRWASYGLGQVMGFNAPSLGYNDANDMFERFRQSEANQLDGMLRFIKHNGLLTALRKGDWRGFAYGYNGRSYATHDYHGRLERAEAMFAKKAASKDPWVDGVLSVGDSGEPVRALQIQLNKLFDAELEVDGDFGRATLIEVQKAQRLMGVEPDGIVGKLTQAAFGDYRKPEPKQIEDALRDNGSRTITMADKIKDTLVEDGVELVKHSGGGFLAFIAGIDPRLIVFVMVLSVGVWLYLRHEKKKAAAAVIAARVDDAATGKNSARLEALL